MLAGAPLSLLLEWQQYFHLRPFGYTRDALMAANICLQLTAAMGGKKKGGGAFKLEDFILQFDKPPKSTSYDPESAKGILRQHYGNNRKPRRKPNRKNR